MLKNTITSLKKTGKQIKDFIEKLIPDFLKRKKPNDKQPPNNNTSNNKPPKDKPKSKPSKDSTPKSSPPKCSLQKESPEPAPPEATPETTSESTPEPKSTSDNTNGEPTGEEGERDDTSKVSDTSPYEENDSGDLEDMQSTSVPEPIVEPYTTNMERILLKEPNDPIFKTRDELSYTINKRLARQIGETLNRIKGLNDSRLGQSGKLNIEEFINMKISEKAGEIPNLKVFDEDIETRGLDMILLVDCSGSMEGVSGSVRNITATIMKALESCSFINFKVFAFSGNGYDYACEIDVIKKTNECKRITADGTTPNNLAIDYAVKDLQNSRNKKMIIMISDGSTTHMYKGIQVDDKTCNNLMERSVMNAKNRGIEMFCLFYSGQFGESELMRRLFRGALYESYDFADIETKLIKELIKSVERLNN